MNWKKCLTAVGFATLSIVPVVAAATSASASESANNCIVTALRPEWRPMSDGSKQVRGVATVYCGATRTASVQLGVREADAGTAYDTMVSPNWTGPLVLRGGTRGTFYTTWARCVNTEIGNEEAYVIARVNSSGYTSPWDSGRSAAQVSLAC